MVSIFCNFDYLLHFQDYLEVQSQAPIDEYGDSPVSVDDKILEEHQLDNEATETTSMLSANGAIEPASPTVSISPPDSPVDREMPIPQDECPVDPTFQRASTSFSADSGCSVDVDMPSTSSPRSSTVNLRVGVPPTYDFSHRFSGGSPVSSPKEKLRPISEAEADVFDELDGYEDRSSSGGGRGATDSGHPSSRGGSYEGSSDSVDSGHSYGGGGTSSSDSYDERRKRRTPPPPPSLNRHRHRNFVVSPP